MKQIPKQFTGKGWHMFQIDDAHFILGKTATPKPNIEQDEITPEFVYNYFRKLGVL